MPTDRELQLEQQLRERDAREARQRADTAANIAAAETAEKKRAAEEATAAERERFRRGAWLDVLVRQQAADDPTAPLDFAAMSRRVPEKDWPAGTSPDDVPIMSDAPPPREAPGDIASTYLGGLLQQWGAGYGNRR